MPVTKSPVPDLSDEVVEGAVVRGASDDITVSAADRKAFQNQYNATEAALKKQPKVRVRLPEDTRVQINGYGFYIQAKTWVEVPEQVAQILEEADRM